jgi:hypothetical protein
MMAALAFLPLLGMAQFKLGAEVRPRAEYLHGFRTLSDSTGQEPAVYIDQRTRLTFSYDHEKFKVFVSVQDIRTWGSTAQTNRIDGFTSLNQAYAEVKIYKGLSTKFGRQQIDYDDARILGNLEWAQQGRSHDAFLLKYEDSTMFIHAGAAYNQNAPGFFGNGYTVAGNYKTMQYLWFHKDFKYKIGWSVLFLNNGMQSFKTDSVGKPYDFALNFSQTAGTRLSYNGKMVSASGNFYYQFGKDLKGLDLTAFNAAADLEVRPVKQFGIGLGYEALSGTGQLNLTNKDNRSFTPFYGTNHKFNGYMDYFYVNNHLGNVGLNDGWFRLRKIGKFGAALDGHMFYTAAALINKKELMATGDQVAMDPYLGFELDLTLNYKVNDWVSLQGGYSHMFASESMETLKGGKADALNNWAYLMITVKPTLLNSANWVKKE